MTACLNRLPPHPRLRPRPRPVLFLTRIPNPPPSPSSLLAALRALPKVELHCHVEGTMRPATVMELARKNGVPLPPGDVRDLYRYGSLDEFLSVFWLVQSVLADQGDWERLGYESVLDGAAAGRVYAPSARPRESSWSLSWYRFGRLARPVPTGCSVSGWTPLSSAWTRCRSLPPTG
jgi:Adenosine deaminase